MNRPEDNIVGISKQTLDLLVRQDNAGDLIALYTFYNYTSKWQGTADVYATVSFAMKGLDWGKERVQKAKAQLSALGLVRDVRVTDPGTGRTTGHFVHVEYVWKQEAMVERPVQAARHVHPPENPPVVREEPENPPTGKPAGGCPPTGFTTGGKTDHKCLGSGKEINPPLPPAGEKEGGDGDCVPHPELRHRLAAAFRLTERDIAHLDRGNEMSRAIYALRLERRDLDLLERLWRKTCGEVVNGQKVWHAETLPAFLGEPLKDITRARQLFGGKPAAASRPALVVSEESPQDVRRLGLFAGVKAAVRRQPQSVTTTTP